MSSIHNSVVLLGSDPHLIRACFERGMDGVIVRDVGAHLCGGDPLPDSFQEVVVADAGELGEVWSGLTRLSGGAPPDRPQGVVTTNEFCVCTAAALAERFDLPGPGLVVTSRMRDKHLQKQAVRAAVVPCVGSRVVVAGSDVLRAEFTGPCVVKPLAAAVGWLADLLAAAAVRVKLTVEAA